MRNVVVMSGVSGSGKSTYARSADFRKRYLNPGGDWTAVSADHHFINLDGEYKFDPAQLSAAHAACFRSFIEALQNAVDLVIVDNTNTTAIEIAPYILGAQAFGYHAEVLMLRFKVATHWTNEATVEEMHIQECASRNKHGADVAAIRRQHHNTLGMKMAPYWNFSTVPVVLGTSAEEASV